MSIAIIGGSDGPTAIYFSGDASPKKWLRIGIGIVSAVTAIIIVLKLIRRKK